MRKRLTPREHEVALHAIFGCCEQDIARKLSVSPHTVRFHMKNLYGKVGCSCRSEMLVKMLLQGYLCLEDLRRHAPKTP